jgi:hypothetical protein
MTAARSAQPAQPALRAGCATLQAAQAAQHAAHARDEERRQAVLYRGTRFALPLAQPPKAGPGSIQARKRRARLPQARKRKGESHEAEPGGVPVHGEPRLAASGHGNSGGGSGNGGGHSQSGQGGHDERRANLPEVRSSSAAPVHPHAGGALPLSAARMTGAEHAEAVRTAFCEALLALRDNPSASRVVGATELQLDRLDAAQGCPPLRETEGMAGLRQRLIDAGQSPSGKRDPFNLLLPLILLIAERPLTRTRAEQSRNTLTSQRNAALARRPRER